MKFFKPKIEWHYKKYLLIANDITNAFLNKEKRREDRRVKKLTIALIILAAVLIASLAFNVYFVTGA
ncbi:MAG: hypothetical protein WC323_01370 [Patescibacteria group bacterium]|jgi:hypothetical protein